MPGSVQNAAISTVLPYSLCTAFVRMQEYASEQNDYRDGSNQRRALTTTSRKRWQLGKRLEPSELLELRDFFVDRRGSVEPFFYYDVYETSPKYSYDITGTATVGRYAVRFDGSWDQSMSLSRADVGISLVEVS